MSLSGMLRGMTAQELTKKYFDLVDPSEAFLRSITNICKLDECELKGVDVDSSYDEMDDDWKKMSAQERKLANDFSALLYLLREKEN